MYFGLPGIGEPKDSRARAAILEPLMRDLGLDVGDRRIGVALSDETGTLASAPAHARARGSPQGPEGVAALVREHDAEAIVVGLPRDLDGRIGPQAEKVLRSWRLLAPVARVPVHSWDERLTTVVAEQILIEARGAARAAQGPGGPGGGHPDPAGLPRRESRRRRVPCLKGRSLRRALLVLLLLLLGLACWLVDRDPFPQRLAPQPPQVLVVEPGQGAREIGASLHALGLVRHPQVFRLHVLTRGDAGRLRTGEYSLEGALSLDQIVDLLVRGDVVRRTVTFPEGRDLEEMARSRRAAGPRRRRVPGGRARRCARSATSIRRPRTSRATSSPTPTT